MTARAALTRARRSLRHLSSARSSSSRESSGSPLVVSHTVNRWIGVGNSSGSPVVGIATRDSTRDREPYGGFGGSERASGRLRGGNLSQPAILCGSRAAAMEVRSDLSETYICDIGGFLLRWRLPSILTRKPYGDSCGALSSGWSWERFC
jgi:hypothetical protein